MRSMMVRPWPRMSMFCPEVRSFADRSTTVTLNPARESQKATVWACYACPADQDVGSLHDLLSKLFTFRAVLVGKSGKNAMELEFDPLSSCNGERLLTSKYIMQEQGNERSVSILLQDNDVNTPPDPQHNVRSF